MNLRYSLYRMMAGILSKGLRNQLGASPILSPLRDWLFRPHGTPEIIGGIIGFCGNIFHFQAPFQIYECAKRRGIESRISRLILRNGKTGGVYFDVGANYGFLTLIMAIKAGSSGKVYSFEPVERINRVLAGNIRMNGFDGFAAVVGRPVANQEDLRWENRPEFKESSVSTTITIDGYVQREHIQHIDLIKIDVDGADYQVLLGGSGTIRRDHPILIVEMMEHQAEIYQYLVDANYPYIYDMQGKIAVPPNWPPNIIASTTVLNWND